MITNPDSSIAPIPSTQCDGLTKREHFALKLMQAFLIKGSFTRTDDAAFQAVRGADYLIEQLNKGRCR